MIRIIKLVFGAAVLSGLGLLYGEFNKTIDEMKEPQVYSHIAYYIPAQNATMTMVKQTLQSECEKWREEYFNASIEQCKGCEVLKNECSSIISNELLLAFQGKDISSPYILKPYSSPELTILKGFPDSAFSQMCSIHKESLKNTVCIN